MKLHFRIIEKVNPKWEGGSRWFTQVKENGKWVAVKRDYDAKAFVKGDPIWHKDPREAIHDLIWCCHLTHNLNWGTGDYDCKVIDRNGKLDEKKSWGDFLKKPVKEDKADEPPKQIPDHRTTELFICDCSDIHHQFVVTIDPDPGWQMVSVEVMLNRNLGFFKRLWAALKYLFANKPSRFGFFDEIILKKSDADRLQKVVDAVRKYGEEH